MGKLTATTGDWRPSGPVRTIGVQSRSITGTMPDGNRYESALERDFMLLLQFDPTIDVYTPQPLTIPYSGVDGRMHRYTPDGFIEWRGDVMVEDPRPMLVEVKYREAFVGNWRHWRRAFRAATTFAQERGWQFAVFSERQIRTPMLDNVRFLLPYRNRQSTPEVEEWILQLLTDLIESTPRTLISLLYQDKWNQAAVLPVVWKLMAQRRISFLFDEPLGMDSLIWSLREKRS